MKFCSRFFAWILNDPGNYYLKTLVLMGLGFGLLVVNTFRRTIRGN